MRRIVGERMTQSKQSAPHFYLSMDIDMSAITRLRSAAKQQGEGNPPSINDFILHACAGALKDFPSLNASFTEAGINLRADINLGMAIALEEGLVVPVIRNADRLSLTELAARSRELINPPQCAILAVGRVAPRVVADDGMFAIKPSMTATLSADHRVVDGAIGARFLQTVKQLLETPAS